MTKRASKVDVIIERDRLYAEHMYRKEKGSPGGAEREPKRSDHQRLSSKPGALESFVLWLLGD
jgi:hypothetical protein